VIKHLNARQNNTLPHRRCAIFNHDKLSGANVAHGIYQLMSRANGNEKLFRQEENYRFFLEKTRKYIYPVAELLSYCLIPNQFQFVVQIKSEDKIEEYFSLMKPEKTFNPDQHPDFVMERFSNLLNSYAKSYNKVYDRVGSLFIDFLRRKEISTENQLLDTIVCIHNIPVEQGCCDNPFEWRWSSLWPIMNQQSRLVSTGKVLQYFGGPEQFQNYHNDKKIVIETSL
jgi:putative transposase